VQRLDIAYKKKTYKNEKIVKILVHKILAKINITCKCPALTSKSTPSFLLSIKKPHAE